MNIVNSLKVNVINLNFNFK